MGFLKRARDKIASAVHWCQGARAKNAAGTSVEPDSPNAVQWCSTGALLAVCGGPNDDYHINRSKLYRASKDVCSGGGVIYVNDNTDHETVLKMFDLAIASDTGVPA